MLNVAAEFRDMTSALESSEGSQCNSETTWSRSFERTDEEKSGTRNSGKWYFLFTGQ